jgi:antitoxin component YwqK of YwqJK toxin-antitoxin module
MKRLLLIVLPLLLIVGCSKEPINHEFTLIERNGVFYTKDTNKPYSGPVLSIHKNGVNSEQGTLEDGKKHGLWIQNYENGKVYKEENYNYGVKNGSFKEYHEDGSKYEISNYLNGQLHGKYYWGFYGSYKHGNYSYGKKDGVWTDINNGNITKVTFKDGIEISSE